MKLFSFLLRHSRPVVILAIVAGIISGASNTGLLALINMALNKTHSGSTLILSFVGLSLGLAVSRAASELLLLRLGQGALFDLRMNLSRQILGVPLRSLEQIGAHRLLTVLTDDVPTITNVVNMIPVLCINVAVVIACLIYLGWLSLSVLLVILGVIVLGVTTYQAGVARAFRYLTLARAEGNSLFKHFQALTEGAKELKLHHRRRQSFLNEVLHSTADSFRRNSLTGMTIYTIAASWGQLLVFVVIGLLLFVIPGFNDIGKTTLIGFTLVFLYMMTPLQVIMNALPGLGRGAVALNNVENLGLTLSSHEPEQNARLDPNLEPEWSLLEMAGVTYAYVRDGEESRFVLGPLYLTLCPGELVFLAGGNGSGKTTLAKLITGLYAPAAGTIFFDGKPVTDQTREQYRQHFSVVFSDFYLFESLLGLEAPGLDTQARSYLTQLQLAHKVEVKDGAFSTKDLSQGQRKRLALLTAYLEDRPIYIFDEWAADQDPVFKEIFYLQLLLDLKARGKTILVISHDDRYYHVADRILKLDCGKIADDRATTRLESRSVEVF